MKFVCLGCGKVFDESEVKRVEESRGEFWGSPCTETMFYSPCCTDDYDVAYRKGYLAVTGEMREYIKTIMHREPQTKKDAFIIASDFLQIQDDGYVSDADFTTDDCSEIEYKVEY